MTPVRVRTVDGDEVREQPDRLVTEEPMEIRLPGPSGELVPVAVTMRTPGSDFELAVGFLHSEGLIRPDDVASVAYCLEGEGEQRYNVVTVRTRRPVDIGITRTFAANASCGICGKTTLDEIEVACPPLAAGPVIDSSTLVGLPERLREHQSVFDATGGVHAAACFDVDGSLTVLREDVGRHNALDKVVGWAVLEGRVPLSDQVLLVSGRASFEIVQKAAVAGIPVVCSVSAPSSLAAGAAERLGQTLVGFLRGQEFNVYARPERVGGVPREREC